MAYFNLNVSKLNDSISKYEKCKKNCITELDSIYENLKNSDSGWNDNNSILFIENVKKDKYKIDNYFDEFDLLYKQIGNFRDSINNLFASHGFSRNSTLKYNDAYYNSCIRNLNNAITYLNNALAYLNSCNFRSDFEAYYRVCTLRSEIKSLKTTIRGAIDNVNSFKKSIDKILADTQNSINKNKGFDLNIELMTYNWKTVSFEIKKSNVDVTESQSAKGNLVKKNNASFSNEILSRNTTSVTGVVKNIIDENTDDYNSNYKVGSNIASQKVFTNNIATDSEYMNDESLSRNTISATGVVENTINENIDDYNTNFNLRDNVESQSVNSNGSNYHFDSSDLNSTNNNYDIGNNISSVNDNIKNSSVNVSMSDSASINKINTFESHQQSISGLNSQNFNLSNNISRVDATGNSSINVTTTNNVNLSNGISSVEINNKGISSNISSSNLNLGDNINKINSLEDLNN